MSDLLIRGGVLGGRQVDVRIHEGLVVEVGTTLRRGSEEVLEAGGGAVLPGLHDHHAHLHATAAALASVHCGPPTVRTAGQLSSALRTAAARGPVRGVGYHESVAGLLDRQALDALVPDVPVRVQHRSGAGWFLNTAALRASGLETARDPAVERDDADRPTGRVWRGDHLLRSPETTLPDLALVGHRLASVGVTGVTDATPGLDDAALTDLRAAHLDGRLPQRPLLLGAPIGDDGPDVGPWKVVLDEAAGLDLDGLIGVVEICRAAGRAVALHAVTSAEAVVAVTALGRAGPVPGARIEHGSVLPPSLDADLHAVGVTVVTQPHFVVERGDSYLADVEPRDVPHLYRCASLLAAGVPVAAGTDAPYGQPDPWLAVAAAVARTTPSGAVLGVREEVAAPRALQLFLGSPYRPGGPARRVALGSPADLCVLDCPLEVALTEPSREHVRATVIAGRVIFERGQGR